MKLKDIEIVNLVKSLIMQLPEDEVQEVRDFLCKSADSTVEPLGENSFKNQPVIQMLEEARSKEPNTRMRQRYTRMVNGVMYHDEKMTVDEFLKISRRHMLNWKNVGKKTLDTVLPGLKAEKSEGKNH